MRQEILDFATSMSIFLPPLQADFQLMDQRTIAPPPINGSLAVFGAAADLTVPPDTLSGWASFTREALVAEVFAGGHYYLFQQMSELAGVIRRCVAMIQPE